MLPLLRTLASITLILVSRMTGCADVLCAPIFSDHMVLQRDQVVQVWGTADVGEIVSVEFAGQRQQTTANASGSWHVALNPMPLSREGRTLTIRGRNELIFADVLVGEVWFCSGQSNMEKPLGPRKGQRPVDNFDLELATARHPQLRLFQVPRTDLPQTGAAVLRWLPCTPETLQQSDFSAAAYFFGQQLEAVLDVPVGIIHSSFGGTRIEAWMPPVAFTQDERLQGLEQLRYHAWVPGVQATELYRTMVEPYVPYSLRGFLWYQGETNCMNADDGLYAAKQTALISSWRDAWNTPDAPFYFALLAPFDYSTWETAPKRLTPQALPAFWEAQLSTLTLPHTAAIVTTDLVDNLHDIHPTNKRDVGLRFARLALVDTYARPGIVAHGPRFTAMTPQGNAIELSFAEASGLRSRDGRALNSFTIAGDDQVFHSATAVIAGEKIIVSHPGVSAPVAVRFAWHETAQPNLINRAGLPAFPFRTDRWPIALEMPAVSAKKLGTN